MFSFDYGVWGFGENTTDGKYTFIYNIRGEVHDSNMGVPRGVNLDHLIKVMLAGFLHSKVTVSPFHLLEVRASIFYGLNLGI